MRVVWFLYGRIISQVNHLDSWFYKKNRSVRLPSLFLSLTHIEAARLKPGLHERMRCVGLLTASAAAPPVFCVAGSPAAWGVP